MFLSAIEFCSSLFT